MSGGRGARILLGLAVTLLATVAIAAPAGVRWNISGSLPRGLYRVTEGQAHRGAIVTVCLRPRWAALGRERGYVGRGTCPGRTRPLGKPVVAVAGDTVELTRAAITVNGRPLPNSATYPTDRRGRPLPHHPWGRYILQAGELWLFSHYHPRSFDSRYFGPVHDSEVIGIARPLWTARVDPLP